MKTLLVPAIALLILIPALVSAMPKTQSTPVQPKCMSPDAEVCAMLKS